MRRRAGVLASLAMLALLVGVAEAPARTPAEFWGVNIGPLSGPELQRMKRARVRLARSTLYWAAIEGAEGQFNWSGPDAVIGNLASKGVRFLPVIYGSPDWAASAPSKPPLRDQAARQGWKEFLQELAARYGPGGHYWTDFYPSQHPGGPIVPITAWQIWNEPNIPDHYFNVRRPVKKYARLLRISSQTIRGRSPHARIILAGMPGFAARRAWYFLERLYRRSGIKRSFDAVALHPYSVSRHQFVYEIERTREVMRQHDRHTPIWLTEVGWGSAKPDGTFNKGRKGQKRMLRMAFRLTLHERHRWHVRHLFWFQWRDPPSPIAGCSLCSYTGLFRSDGSPKPAWPAFRHFTKQAH